MSAQTAARLRVADEGRQFKDGDDDPQGRGFWTHWIFDLRAKTSGQDLSVASDMLELGTRSIATFTRVTWLPRGASAPRARGVVVAFHRCRDDPDGEHGWLRGDGSTMVKENYTRWWAPYRDNMRASGTWTGSDQFIRATQSTEIGSGDGVRRNP
ncbi:hypothetical protein B0H14DRAFT_3472843 [Mycena olivaceomarginata]|nr:hypothetical protein B0H14DRAFT_3472843 [Mycena olivaceomarginata]